MPNLPQFPSPRVTEPVLAPITDLLDTYRYTTGAAIQESMGKFGSVVETGTTAITGAFCAIQMIEDTVFSTLTSGNWQGDAATGVTFTAGTTIYGEFSAFTLTSGKVIAYNRAPNLV